MSTLVEEVKNSFEISREQHAPNKGPVVLIKPNEDELAPGFDAAREHYGKKLLAYTRRGYRWFAGSTMPTDSDTLIETTWPVMGPLVISVLVESFSDGVLIGQREDYQVQMCFHFGVVEHLFHDKGFRETSTLMAAGFAGDREVMEYFEEYLQGALTHLVHATGFAHQEVQPNKVWDVWLLTTSAVMSASFLAGQRLGTAWRTRDVLDGIEMATEEGHGPAGEAD